jgi:hypothetical protein
LLFVGGWHVSGQLPSFVPILCCCSWVQGMGAPRFSCVVMPVFCRGGQSSFVGGWSGRSSSLVGVVVLCVLVVVCGWLEFCRDGGWFVSFVGGRGSWGGRPTSLLWAVVLTSCHGRRWLWVGVLLVVHGF